MEGKTEKQLFLAVCFPEPVKEELSRRTALLEEKAVKGGFNKRETLRLALAFLGRTARQRKLEALMEEIDSPRIFAYSVRAWQDAVHPVPCT